MVTGEEKKVYRPNELRGPFGITRDRAFAEIAAGRLRSFTIGRSRFITAEAINDYIRQREQEAGAKRKGLRIVTGSRRSAAGDETIGAAESGRENGEAANAKNQPGMSSRQTAQPHLDTKTWLHRDPSAYFRLLAGTMPVGPCELLSQGGKGGPRMRTGLMAC